MKIAVIGLGKIGLPLAAQYANKGHQVVGVDIDTSHVELINAGVEPFPGEAHLGSYLERLVSAGDLRATTDYADAVPHADAIVVVVPLFVDRHGAPDFRSLDSATQDIATNLTPGSLVIYETTLPVGTTRNRWRPMLEKSGLIEGEDFHLVFSPERVLTGRVFQDLRKYPKLLGGLTEAGARTASSFYQRVLDFDERVDLDRGNGVWDLGSAEAAELTKLAETTYRDVNIGLANQFARFAETAGIDIYQVIAAANSQPYSHIHRPGISVGGHCIPVYPRLYLTSDPEATIVRAAREVNAAMPRHAVDMLAQRVGDLTGSHILVLGAAYRPGVKETAFSGVFDIVEELHARGAHASVHDPLYSSEELKRLGLSPYQSLDPVDAAILHTDHPEYQVGTEIMSRVPLIVDGRNCLKASDSMEIIRIGIATDPLDEQDH